MLYKGPFRQVIDDDGQVYPRGERVSVNPARAELLRRGSAAGQFLFFDTAAPGT